MALRAEAPPEPPRPPAPRMETETRAEPQPTAERTPSTEAPPAKRSAPIGDEDSELTRALWAKLSDDLGPAMGSNGRPTNGAATAVVPTPRPEEPAAPRPTNGAAKLDTSITSQCWPCSPQAAAEGVIEQDGREPFAVWEELVARIRSIDEYTSAVLGDLALVDLAGGVLRVAAPPRSFAYKELASRPEIRATVEQACRDHLGAPHDVQLVEGEAELPLRPSITLVDAQRRAAHQAAVEAEAAEHASIRALLRTFNAKITGTKPLQ